MLHNENDSNSQAKSDSHSMIFTGSLSSFIRYCTMEHNTPPPPHTHPGPVWLLMDVPSSLTKQLQDYLPWRPFLSYYLLFLGTVFHVTVYWWTQMFLFLVVVDLHFYYHALLWFCGFLRDTFVRYTPPLHRMYGRPPSIGSHFTVRAFRDAGEAALPLDAEGGQMFLCSST